MDEQPAHGVLMPSARLSAADIRDEMWLEAARHRPGNAPEQAAASPKFSPPALLPAPTAAPSLPGLLALEGAAFVDAAYQAVLGRAADDAGTAYVMREMAAGTSKIILLGQLQRSVEGKLAGRTLPGLRKRYAVQRLYRVPVLGGGVRLVGFTLRHTGLSRALAGGKAASPTSRRAEQDNLLRTLGAAQEAMARRAAEQEAAIEAAAQRIGALQAVQEEGIRSGAQAQAQALEAAMRRLALQEDANQRNSATIVSQGRALANLAAQGLSLERRLTGAEDSSIETLLTVTDTLADLGRRLAAVEHLLDGEAIAAQIGHGAAALRQTLDERLSRAEDVVRQGRERINDQERRIGLMLETLRSRPESLPPVLQAQDDRAVEALYVDFEDRFRGTRDDIKQRLRFYLPILAEAGAGTPGRPVADVGCGRGEFLELLQAEGLTARGVDSNAAMVAGCRERGLECVAEDALAYLARQPAGSLGAVTGFHIIEHLPFKTMVRLFDAALHALAPGGLVVFETPNPANLLVASRWFYLDPTHRNPLPGEMVAMIAEARGFCRVSVVDLHPMEQRFGGNDPVLREQLNAIFHGPQDYALLARKP